ncbi:hypothetical protein B0H19DRAFT_1066383 [Mycena capillaripes]|nr:hypothetical protein B0H19DRAFT_1066383 [Mycena capillaripes]
MAGQPNTLIILGSSPDSYYIGHGRRHFVENMPDSFTEHAKKDLTISMTRWIRCKYFCRFNFPRLMLYLLSRQCEQKNGLGLAAIMMLQKIVRSTSGESRLMRPPYTHPHLSVHFNTGINQTILDHLSGVNGKFAAEYVSFPDNEDPAHHFVKGRGQSQWSGWLDDYFIAKLLKAQKEVPNFDADLTGILFGKGKTFIIMSRTGFTAYLDDDEIPSSSEEHPLRKVLEQYSEGWCIDRASMLCFYDSIPPGGAFSSSSTYSTANPPPGRAGRVRTGLRTHRARTYRRWPHLPVPSPRSVAAYALQLRTAPSRPAAPSTAMIGCMLLCFASPLNVHPAHRNSEEQGSPVAWDALLSADSKLRSSVSFHASRFSMPPPIVICFVILVLSLSTFLRLPWGLPFCPTEKHWLRRLRLRCGYPAPWELIPVAI